MIEMRWLVYQEDEPVVPNVHETQYGKPIIVRTVTKRRLQYRQWIDVTVRAGGAGTWDNASLARTANWQWSEWQDVPDVMQHSESVNKIKT